ncbi:BREX system P-loop protein BrxC [Bacteroides uniformis]|uniref:BREX system P-loop protein BrxC n=1 Tax=Bacteroides uniformis TaxID=820 RepID=UPI0022E077F2|nr:BREX system P-loop protein BrxC [Bacteroides uniformis]
MKFQNLYEKGLDRKVNPAVSASDLTDDTVLTEIVEYVFTEEIIINLYNILTNIKHNQGSHVGIWINGYYGSGKSHFLKYASYCLSQNKERCEMAFIRLIEATEDIMLHTNGMSKLEQEGVSVSELKSLRNWYVSQADVEMVMFNIGDVHDVNADQQTAFTTIFWNQFNARRGFNSFNLALAQYLEKALDDNGKFGEFKDYVKSKGYDWERNISRFAAGRLDLALQMGKEIDPTLSTDVIRTKIMNNDVSVSVESFAAEMKEYIDSKQNRNFRILFFVDEVSQFIGEHRDLILQLQSLVKRLEEVCESRCWIACTAQQTLEEVVTNVGGNTTNPEDEVGKILGRFEVRASLQGTSPEYITQKRILEKKGDVEITLGEMFEKDKAKLDAQFVLPSTYKAYSNKEDFIACYPFVPYQFQLIMKVLNSFVDMNYVDKQVKGNERSLINITFSIAKDTAQMEVGEFVSFDRFFGAMFQGSMQHLGQRALSNARHALDLITDPEKQEFYRRVVYVLFMVCNLSDVDKQSFSATIDNIVTLLMTKIDASKAAIKQDVSTVLAFLIDKAVIRKVKTDNGAEIYEFYTEEESKVAQLISNQQVDSNTYSDELKTIFFNHFGNPSNKENYATRSFNVGINIDGRNYLSNNADVCIDFVTTASTDSADMFAFSTNNSPQGTHLIFFLYPLIKDNKELRANFLYYCRVQRFAQEPAISEERQRTKRLFQERAKDLYEKEIKPQFQHILDTCPVISCGSVLSAAETGSAKKIERYKTLLARHMESLYQFAQLVNVSEVPKNNADLSAKILRPIDETTVQLPMSTPEKKIKDYLDRSPHDVTVNDIVRQFTKVPYGWSDYATIYFLNELVRRHLYAFNYNNNPNVSREETARNIVRDANKFTVEKAKAISQDVLNNFIDAWKKIFNVMSVKGSNDSTELFRNCKETDDSVLNKLLKNYRELARKINGCPFADTIDEAITLMEKWLTERDPLKFFQTIIEARDEATQLFDRCKSINSFHNDQFDLYQRLRNFLDDNRDNFAFLPHDQQQTIESLRAMMRDTEPWDKMPSYNKIMKNLNGQLQECKAKLIADIKSRYNKVFDELEQYAQEVGVSRDKFAKRDVTISLKTNTGNFYALQANANTSAFYEGEMKKINDAIPIPTPPVPNPDGDGDDDPQPPTPPQPKPRVRKVIHLNTHTTQPMRSEADVDLYLAGLKAELMQYINNDNDIIVN